MELEDKIKNSLLIRGFSKELLLNNRGLIGATIDETILVTVKTLTMPVVSERFLKSLVVENIVKSYGVDLMLVKELAAEIRNLFRENEHTKESSNPAYCEYHTNCRNHKCKHNHYCNKDARDR